MMTQADVEYWPFPVSESDRQWPEVLKTIAFLEKVSVGFKGYRFGINNFGAESATHEGIIIERGRKRWEVRLAQNGERRFTAFVSDFAVAGQAVISWLDGASVGEILKEVENDLVVPPGLKTSYVVSESSN